MADRHLSRSIALQSLFEWDFRGQEAAKLKEIADRNIAEFAPGLEDPSFIYQLLDGVVKKRTKLDLILSKAAPEWPVGQIAAVDRNVLRLGLFELLFSDKNEVPSRVAINEAIELAKTFGGDNSGRFVNGVLGAVYRELGEPGKDEVPAKRRRAKDIPYAEMPVEHLVGAVIYVREGSQVFFALVHDVFGYWTLSKGHLLPGENRKEGLARVISGELSLSAAAEEELGKNEYVANDAEKGKIRKEVTYFLGRARNKAALKPPAGGGLDDAAWFPPEKIADLRIYDDVVPFITKAIKLIVKKE